MAVRSTRTPVILLSFFATSLIATTQLSSQVVVRQGRMVPSSIRSSQPTQAATLATNDASPVGPAGSAAVSNDQDNASPPSPRKQLLEMLLAAKFDRTTQAVLKAWSHNQPKTPADATGPRPEVYTATIVNAYETFVVLTFDSETKVKKDDIIVVSKDNTEIGKATVLRVDGKTAIANLNDSSEADTATTGAPAHMDASESADENPGAASKDDQSGESNPSARRPDEGNANDENAVDGASGSDSTQTAPATEQTGSKTEQTDFKTGDVVSVVLAPDLKAAQANAAKSAKLKVDAFVRNVTLGQWDEVKSFLSTMDTDDANKVYAHLLTSLASATLTAPEGVPPEVAQQMLAQMQQNGQTPPTSFLTPDDILQLSEASPVPIRLSMGKKSVAGKPGDGVSGKWEGQVVIGEIASEPISFSMTLTRKQDRVTGSVTANDQTVSIANGSYDESTGAVTFSSADERMSGEFNGNIQDGNLTGTMNANGITLNVEAELIEPVVTAVASTNPDKEQTTVALPPGVTLPPGISIEDLPPATLAQIQRQSGGTATIGARNGSSHINLLARLINSSRDAGHDFSQFVQELESGTTHFGSEDPLKRLTAADLLMKSGLTDDVESFLPSLNDKNTESDLPALKLWSRLAITKYRDKRVAEWLEKAWRINQIIVAMEDVNATDKDNALSHLIELSPQVDKELGQEWLNASFTENPDRGMLILTNLGTKLSTMASKAAQISEDKRLKLLRLQNKAVERLIEVSPETASQWNQAITLLAWNWLNEANISILHSRQNSRQAYMQIDMYGNYYWVNQDDLNRRYGNNRQPRPIKPGDILEIAPGKSWQAIVSPSLHLQLNKILANLHLRINEEDKAFPFIEEIAPAHPDIARDLVHEFLRIWTSNHDPNTDKRQRNPYIYFYGFDQKAEAIPLTRSKQERNIRELAGWVERIRTMPIENVDEQLLANAFTTCHSSAEVFRLDRVRSVFGDLENLKPETIAAICQKMRQNLSSNWRDIRNQEAKQTNRREPEVQQEVLRGYRVARELADEALMTSPDSWQLHLALACLMFDENAYSQSVQKSAEFSDRRDMAFEQFRVAADKYSSLVMSLEEKEQSTEVFDYWFYASLGACDLGKITDKTQPDLRQYATIRDALDTLPGSMAEVHMSRFANNMFTRMSPIKPEIKFRYLRGGFEIVGDHPRAWEARNLYDYYKDLVSEIQLALVVDGDVNVGHDQPFGAYVNLLHTTEIERESGGFSKYVQNQNNMPFAYNYGRPTEDYRDKFANATSQALEEHFEILNITFQSPDGMQSRPSSRAGWRVTPYAYVLLKPRGSEIDRIAPLKLDLDFLDTSGYVVIPVESPAVVIDSSSDKATPRPVSDLQVTQTLDERQADEGKLIVEISASAKGLIPDLKEILNLNRESFEVVSVDDQGVLPTSFDKDSDAIQILSDRSWTVEYRARESGDSLHQFSFSDSRLPDASVKFQRYEDADLVAADATVDLEKNYASFSWKFLYWLIPLIVLGLTGIASAIYLTTRPREVAANRFNIPGEINPFTVLTLLKDIRERNGISTDQASELQTSINRVEEYYFGKADSESSEDLVSLANLWINRAN